VAFFKKSKILSPFTNSIFNLLFLKEYNLGPIPFLLIFFRMSASNFKVSVLELIILTA